MQKEKRNATIGKIKGRVFGSKPNGTEQVRLTHYVKEDSEITQWKR